MQAEEPVLSAPNGSRLTAALSHGICRRRRATPHASPGAAADRRERCTQGLSVPKSTLSDRKPKEGNTRGLRSQLKDSVPVTGLSPQAGAYGVQDTMRRGFSSVKNELLPSHTLEISEKNFQLNQDKMNFSTLRNIQGLHAPLKLQMEYKAARQIQRLPFLQSSNLALDTLRGSDDTIGFEDILNDPTQSEMVGEPHMMVEYKLGLL
ncbi:proteasome maturation protein [Clupea harengus]|uniref:Proteasome maturation protein n=1 Tax=Clupea harengus TaxID=7950 RepID=A0A6P8FQH3_CLUHA|nr:proteasome maturation protein [Clupea harengus]